MRSTSSPSPLDEKIFLLVPGDEVIILKGEGYPPVLKETATIVCKVGGTTALTANGTRLSSAHLSDLIITERRFETYFVSAEALQIWGEMLAEQKEAKSGTSLDWSVPDQFPSEPE